MWSIGLIRASEVYKIQKLHLVNVWTHILAVLYVVVILSYEMPCLTQDGNRYSEGTFLYSFIVSSYRLPGSSNRMVPLVKKSSSGDSVKPSGGKLHSFRSREDRHQKGTSRLMVKRDNTDIRHGVQGEKLLLFIVFMTEKV